MKINLCPKCKSDRIELYSGGLTGSYFCRKCSYLGPIILEKEIKKRTKSSS